MEKMVKTFCGICERACGMQVTIKENKVQKVEGLKEHLHSRGDLCIKGKNALDILNAPDRLRHPVKKENGGWKQISWDEVLNLTAHTLDKLKKDYGANSLAIYHGQTYVQNSLVMFCMTRFLSGYGTVNLSSAASECFVPHLLNGVVTFGGLAFADVENSKCIVIWGSNPFASGSTFGGSAPHTIRILNELKEEGVHFIIIDPRTPTVSKIANMHLRVRPGTDGALALGMMRVIIEQDLYDKEYVEKYTSGFDKLREMVEEYNLEKVEKITTVPRNEIEQAAHTLATTKPVSIIPGVGVEHQTNTVQTLRAISILLTITGNIDVKGGNTFISMPSIALGQVDDIHKPSGDPLGKEEHPMFVSMTNQAHALVVIEKILEKEESPIKALIVAGGAPLAELANTNKVREALKKVQFITVIDLFMTETSQYADIVLPAAFFLERDEVGTMPLNLQNKVVDGGECWPDWKFWWELAKKMGYRNQFPWQTQEEAINALLKPAGLTYEELKKHPGGYSDEIPPGKFLKEGFNTYSGKIEIYSHSLESNGYDPLPVYREPLESVLSRPQLAREYPLTLTTGGRLPMYLHSQHRNIPSLRKLHPEPYLEIHPTTAQDCEVGDGDEVVVESERGTLKVKAKLTEGIIPQVVHLPHGWVETDCNLLTDHQNRDPISGFPGLKSSLCRVKKA